MKRMPLMSFAQACKAFTGRMISPVATALLLMPMAAQAIIEGEVSSKPWVVEVVGTKPFGGLDVCVGTAVSASVVITAEHCLADAVTFDNYTINVASRHPVPGIDVQILILARPNPLAEYPTLGPNYRTLGPLPAGRVATTYGYSANRYPQKSLSIQVLAHGLIDGREVLKMTSPKGHPEHGDSGAPLILDGMLVGVLRGAFETLPNGKLVYYYDGLSSTLSMIRELEHSRQMRSVVRADDARAWLSAVEVNNGALTFTLSHAFIQSGRRVVAWINGRYTGEVVGNKSYYAYEHDGPDGVTYSMGGIPVRDSDIVKIGLATGHNNADRAELLYKTPPYGIEKVAFDNGALAIRMSAKLAASGHKVVVWVNGRYTGAVENNTVYYGSKQRLGDSWQLRFANIAVNYGDSVQVGVLTTGSSPNTSFLLYEGRPSGIESVKQANGYVAIALEASLLNSGKRVIVWIDGTYAAEVYNGQLYYLWYVNRADGSKEITPYLPARADSLIQIGVVPGAPGMKPGTPASARLLYSDVPY
jgi:hypothetical protein